MPIDVPWTTDFYGDSDLTWYCGSTAVGPTNDFEHDDYALCRHRRVGGVLTFQIVVQFRAQVLAALATAGSGDWKFEIPPLAQVGVLPWALSSWVFDASVGYVEPMLWLAASEAGGTPTFYVQGYDPPSSTVANAVPMTWATGDLLVVSGSVEAFGN